MTILAKHIMQTCVRTVRPDLPLADLERRFVDDDVSGYPVVDGGEIRGVVTVTDVLRKLDETRSEAEIDAGFYEGEQEPSFQSVSNDWVSAAVGRRMDHLRVVDVMNEHVIAVSPDASLPDVAALLSKEQIHRVLVVDDRRLVGVISSLDVARSCGGEDVITTHKPPEVLDYPSAGH